MTTQNIPFVATIINHGTYYTVRVARDINWEDGRYSHEETFCSFGDHFMTEAEAEAFTKTKKVVKVVRIANEA